MTAGSAWPARGPRPRDELAAWTTAQTPDVPLGPIPELGDPPPSGWTESVRGRGMFVRSVDGPAERPPAWFVHGLAGASSDWTRLAGAVSPAAAGFCVDLPGHGRSDPPPRGRYSLAVDADLIAAAIEQVSGGPVHLVGNSLGGFTTTLLAARRPDLVRTLTLISPAVPDLRVTRDRGADVRLGVLLAPGTARPAMRVLSAIDPESRVRGMGEACFGDPTLIDANAIRVAAAEHAWRATLPWAHAGTVGALRSLMSSHLRPGRWSFRALATRIRVPVLVIWGTRDRLVDVRLSRPTAAAFPDAQLLVLAGVGHVAQLEAPAMTARAVLGLWARSAGEPAGRTRQPGNAAPAAGVIAGPPAAVADGASESGAARAAAGVPSAPERRAKIIRASPETATSPVATSAT